MKQDGFSLIELLVVCAIIATLLTISSLEFHSWLVRYNIEKLVEELYGQIVTTRFQAMARNKTYFVTLAANQYTVVDDIDGSGAPSGGDTTISTSQVLKYPLSWSGATPYLQFNQRGTADVWSTICVSSQVQPAFDCIVVSSSRVAKGKIINQGGACASTNCSIK